jgi:hypothetical protein
VRSRVFGTQNDGTPFKVPSPGAILRGVNYRIASTYARMTIALFMGLCSIAACDACKGSGLPSGGSATSSDIEPVSPPTLRLYVLSDPAGALEPCGCVKDQLGGMDHLAAFMATERKNAPNAALLSVGPTFFMDLERKPDRKAQDAARAEAIAGTLGKLTLVALVAGENDQVGSAAELASLSKTAGAQTLDDAQTLLKEIGGVKVGLLGVRKKGESALPTEKIAEAVRELKSKGAQVVIALTACGRGDAKRLADLVPDLSAIVVGSTSSAGEGNTETPSGERIGNVLIAATGNHVQTVGILDFTIRKGELVFADASSLSKAKRRAELTTSMETLRGEIANLEKSKASSAEKSAALAAARKERDTLDYAPAPAKGSYLRYRTEEVRASFGSEPETQTLMHAYYKRVNDQNKALFADRKPAAPAKGQSGYAGIESCSSCHEDARKVWDKTAHAHAYATLSDQQKEFNLDCVSCHVTGYDKPGGSTVTFVDKLKDVQCEVCHGPGALHAKDPLKAAIPIANPTANACLSCHHAPHVHSFDAAAKLQEVLGPGHGRPKI